VVDKPFSAYRGDGPYVFVCYAHEDTQQVYREIAWLNDYGVNVWYDEGISPGHEWTDELATAIQGCTKVLYFVTPNSVLSEHCRRELNFAQEEGREVVAIHLQATEVPAGLRLSLNNRQAIHKYESSEDEYHQRLIRVTYAGASLSPQPRVPPEKGARRLGLVPASIAIALGVIVVGVWWSYSSRQAPTEVTQPAVADSEKVEPSALLPRSIAVLPFENLSLDPENAYFAAGIHEEILNQLAKVKQLSVIARTTMLRYADTDKTVPEIGAELNVATVMEGSVRYAGNRVRITAQLIDASSGAHLWSEAYEEDLQDIFGIQLAIATRIARTLEAELSTGEQTRIATPSTRNPVAYAHYLRAVSSWGNFAPTEPMHEAIDAAIALDPQFAGALAFKAFLYAVEAIAGRAFVGADFGAEDQRRLASLARDYALRALAIDDAQPRAYWALGWVQIINREWETSRRTMERAYELDPNDYIVLNGAAWTGSGFGDCDAGTQRMARSVALNPGDIANQANFVQFLVMCGRWEEAKRQGDVLTALIPDAAGPYAMLAQIASFMGDTEGVRTYAAMAEARADRPDLGLAMSYRRIGDDANARRIVDALNASGESRNFDSLERVAMHSVVNEYDTALDYLEHALEEGYPWSAARNLRYWSGHPQFDPLRPYPRFQELVRKAGLTPAQK